MCTPYQALYKQENGFTLIELIAVLVLVAILAGTLSAKLIPSRSFELLASRDRLISAFSSAQQLAMAQSARVQFLILAPASSGEGYRLDIRQDNNANSVFASDESIRIDGQQYPIVLSSAHILSHSGFNIIADGSAPFNIDRLGATSGATITLSQGADTVNINVSALGNIE